MQGHEAGFAEFRFDNPQMGRLSLQDDIFVRQPKRFPDPNARAGEQAAQRRPEQWTE
jgi:hypothetical protein